MDGGKRVAAQQGGPPGSKQGPNDDFNDLLDDELLLDEPIDEVADTYMPDDLDEPDPELGDAGRNWTRPAVASLNPEQNALGT